jgi:hypothetical protein
MKSPSSSSRIVFRSMAIAYDEGKYRLEGITLRNAGLELTILYSEGLLLVGVS